MSMARVKEKEKKYFKSHQLIVANQEIVLFNKKANVIPC